MLTDGERRKRLSTLCKRLRGNESVRSFTKKRRKELQGITHGSWGAWESEKAGLSADSLNRLTNFIGCSHQSLFAYLDGSINLEQLFQPTPANELIAEKRLDFSPDATTEWIKSLQPEEQIFLLSQGFQVFKESFDCIIEQKAKELIQNRTTEYIDPDIQKFTEQKTEKLVNKEIKKELAQEIIEETSKLLLNLFSSDKYPSKLEIIKVAEKLNLNVENLVEICDRIYLDKTQKQHKQSA
ncbi:hypothetical protein NIES267_72710 (plasmid) [Calothrix parasitica NIES-267]|uniref:Uncharacterized protein n=1 Tax=Calothrix parasitica NIES-267 TaxID=1973488 RepID=A0A1Z4M2Q2_9CYAN|nr:hypothetical protein NIES267_72710 [Calothrix parasitica NIES-267]